MMVAQLPIKYKQEKKNHGKGSSGIILNGEGNEHLACVRAE